MKKIISTTAILFTCFAAFAQEDGFNPWKNRDFVFDVMRIFGVLLGLYLITSFIMRLFKQGFEFRLKSKIIDRNTPDHIVGRLLKTEQKDSRNSILQWLFVLSGIGVALTLIAIVRPDGNFAVAIMALCIAAGLGGYLYVTKVFGNRDKEQ